MATFIGDPSLQRLERRIIATPALGELLTDQGVIRDFAASFAPYTVETTLAGRDVTLSGHAVAVELAARILQAANDEVAEHGTLDRVGFMVLIDKILQHDLKYALAFRLQGVPHAVRPLTLSQFAFMSAMLNDPHHLVFGIGPTGTGKTHLALAAGLSLLASGVVKHLVVTRPHVLWEGEVMTGPKRAEILNEGQLTPIEDELHSLIGKEATERLIASAQLEIVPLGCLRGRTFNESFILVDESQNLTVHNMRMAVTRIGRDSRMVVLGDPEQVDLHGDELSGLPHLLKLIRSRDIALVHHFRRREIIRDPLVMELEALYSQTNDDENADLRSKADQEARNAA